MLSSTYTYNYSYNYDSNINLLISLCTEFSAFSKLIIIHPFKIIRCKILAKFER